MSRARIVFVTRDPVVNAVGGSTTSALNLLGILARQGAEVTMVATNAYSRSPRLWFRVREPLPEGVRLLTPGFFQVGGTYLNLFSIKGWARALCRAAVRAQVLTLVCPLLERMYGDALYTNAWDLTTPTRAECNVALRAIAWSEASTVMVNYACWAPLLREDALAERKTVILMHDLLSARVQRFQAAGTPLDCPEIDEETEMGWLSSAACVLAAQAREAEFIRPLVSSRVLVQPIVFHAQGRAQEPEAQRCLFVGSNIQPNQTGLAWFLEQVWPKVLATNPQATLAVVGSVGASVGEGLPNVLKLGMVASIEAEYDKSTVCVVPLLIGSGIKIKLIEALSFGKATVSTSIGVQGLEDWVLGAVEVADDAEGFAAAVRRLLDDVAWRKSREVAAVALTRAHYNADAALDPEFVAAVL